MTPTAWKKKLTPRVADCQNFKDRPGVKWLHLEGLQDLTLLQDLGACLGLHPLALEDVVEGRAPIKVDDYPNYLFIVSRLVTDLDGLPGRADQPVFGTGLSFQIQETHTDHFALIRERLRHGSGQIRNQGADYLTYALIDYIVDSWFPLLENFGERLEDLEDRLFSQPDGNLTHRIAKTAAPNVARPAFIMAHPGIHQ